MEDINKYWQELVSKRNIPADVAAKITEALGNESVQRAFKEDFKPLPDYSRDLDAVRDRTKAEADAKLAEYNKWYNETALPAYQYNLKNVEELNKYKQLYGNLAEQAQASNAGFSKEEVEKFVQQRLDEKLGMQNQVFSNLLKEVPKVQLDYYRKFNEDLDMDAIEKLAISKHGGNVRAAYTEYIQPKLDTIREEKHKKELEAAREQGMKDALSRRTPTDNRQREASPLFSSAPKEKDPNAAREAFLQAYDDDSLRANNPI